MNSVTAEHYPRPLGTTRQGWDLQGILACLSQYSMRPASKSRSNANRRREVVTMSRYLVGRADFCLAIPQPYLQLLKETPHVSCKQAGLTRELGMCYVCLRFTTIIATWLKLSLLVITFCGEVCLIAQHGLSLHM